jgi:large subunit ribosomal protein L15
MDLSNLSPAKGSVKNNKRRGRGQGSGAGGTATRGHKGAKSRSGYSRKRAFEGGQMPLQMRLPKRGFKSPNKVVYVPINLTKLQEITAKAGSSEVSPESLYAGGYTKKSDVVKLLGNGEISTAVTVTAHAASASAIKAIEAAGGTVTVL